MTGVMIELFIINILFIHGMQFAFKDGNILNGLFLSYVELFNRCSLCMYWNKALFVCAPCMASVWGWCFWMTDLYWWTYPIWVVCLTGVNSLIGKLTN